MNFFNRIRRKKAEAKAMKSKNRGDENDKTDNITLRVGNVSMFNTSQSKQNSDHTASNDSLQSSLLEEMNGCLQFTPTLKADFVVE